MSKNGVHKLQQVIHNFIDLSPDLVMLFVLIDSRHDIGKTDMDFLLQLGSKGVPFAIIFTKGDKLGPVAREKQIEADKQTILKYWEELPPVFISSSETGLGREEILDYIESVLESLEKGTEL